MNQSPQTAIKFYETGNNFYQKGNLAESEKSYRKAIKIYRDFAEAHGNLGNVLKDQGRLKEAAGAYRKALKIHPKHPLLLNNMGNILQLLGESQKALQYLKEAIKQEPNYADAHNNLGNVLKELAHMEEAVDCYKKALSIKPDFAAAHNNLGNVLTLQGKTKEAIASYQRALEVNPYYIDACNNLGVALQGQNMLDEAITLHRRILVVEPNNKEAYNNLGTALREQGDLSEAVASLHRALEIDPNFKEAYNNLGTTLREQGDLSEAVASLHRALEIDPNFKEGHHNLGQTLWEQGNLDEAISHIQHALKVDPGYPEAHKLLSSLEMHTEYDEHMRTTEALLNRRGMPDNQRMHLCFGLGKAFEDIKEYDKAFGFLLEGNRLKRATIEYSTSQISDFFERIKKVFSTNYFSTHKDAELQNVTPIFILGMPRSGTSLTEQILASHPQVFGGGELKVLSSLINKRCVNKSENNYPECILDFDATAFEVLGSDYIKAIRDCSQTSRHITDKMPHNFIYVGLIKMILPNAKIIHCMRDPMDNCLSIFKNYFGGPHPYAYEMRELGEYYKLYQDLMEHMRRVFPSCMYDLKYEEMVSSQEKQTRKLLEYCGLPWDASCLSFNNTKRTVRTISATQVRRPMYKDSVELWRQYEIQLEPLRAALQR